MNRIYTKFAGRNNKEFEKLKKNYALFSEYFNIIGKFEDEINLIVEKTVDGLGNIFMQHEYYKIYSQKGKIEGVNLKKGKPLENITRNSAYENKSVLEIDGEKFAVFYGEFPSNPSDAK